DLTAKGGADGILDWTAADGAAQVTVVSTRNTREKVKRPAPGGEGFMVNPLFPDAIRDYLVPFEKAFAKFEGPKPRALYHDSFEYTVDWAPDFLTQFEKRRGYRLQDHLSLLVGSNRGDE